MIFSLHCKVYNRFFSRGFRQAGYITGTLEQADIQRAISLILNSFLANHLFGTLEHTLEQTMQSTCICGDLIIKARAQLGYRTCLACGEADAKAARRSWCVVPMHKSNYVLITSASRNLLTGVNTKGGVTNTETTKLD